VKVAFRLLALTFVACLGWRGASYAQAPAPAAPTPEELFRTDVHAKAGLTCESCHATKTAAGAYAAIKRTDVAPMCAHCHADAAYMHKADPRIPVTQFEDWKQSVHAAALQRGDTSAPTCSSCHGAHGIRPVATIKAEEVCGQCHVREADLYKASPKKKIFDENERPACVTCHENHKIEKPGDNWISMKDPVSPCSTCHDDTMKGAQEITLEQRGFQQLTTGIDRAGQVLDVAERTGMLVDDGRDALRSAGEHQIQARVAVHTFTAKPFSAALDPGLKDAARAEAIGHAALAELQFRRKGLVVATALILGFLVTLGLKIRRLPPISRHRRAR
jgi:cytochrome c553